MAYGPKKITMLTSIIVIVAMSVMIGVFLIIGVDDWLHGSTIKYFVESGLIVLGAVAIALHARRILREIPEQ